MKVAYIALGGIAAYLLLANKQQGSSTTSTTAAASGGKIVWNPNQGAGNASAAGYPMQFDQQGSLMYGHVGPTPGDIVNAGNTSDIPTAPLSHFHQDRATRELTEAQQHNAIVAYRAALEKNPAGYANAFLSLNAAQQYAQISGDKLGPYRLTALYQSGKLDRNTLDCFINWNNENNVGLNPTAPAARSYQSFLS